MNSTNLFFLAQTVLIPIGFCLLRFKDVKRLYLPLFIYLLIKEVTETISYFLIHYYHTSNALPYNFMFLAEAMLITWQFCNLGTFDRNKRLYAGVQIFWILFWLMDMFYIGSIFEFNIVFRVGSCFILVFLATPLISKLAITERYNMYRNTAFLLALIFACWFTYNILYEFSYKIAHINDLYKSIGMRVTKFIGFAEAIMYLICAWAVYCIPAKRNFSLT